MPRPVATDKNGARYTTDPVTNEWRPLTDEEFGSAIPAGILDEQGVTDGTRFLVKNLAPPTALAMLQLKGYQAVQYGDGYNFAVRRSSQEPWKLVDPDKGGISEFWRDVVDLLGDIGVGAATAAGTAGGFGVASMATGAASGAGAEAVRQTIARSIAGLPQGLDIPEIVGSAIGGGIAPPVGRAIGGAARGIVRGVKQFTRSGGALSRAGEAFTKKVTETVKGAQGMEISEIMLETAARKGQPVFTPEDGVMLLRQHMDEIAEPQLRALAQARDAAVSENSTVNLFDMRRTLRGLSGIVEPSGELKALSPDARAKLQQVVVGLLRPPSKKAIEANLRASIGPIIFGPGGEVLAGGAPTPAAINAAWKVAVRKWQIGLQRVPGKAGMRLKKVLQNELSDRKGLRTVGVATPGAAKPAGEEETRLLGTFVKRLTDRIHRDLPKRVAALDSDLSKRINARDGLRGFFGAKKLGEADAAFNNMRGALKPGNEKIVLALKEYDRQFPGLGFETLARRAARLPSGATRTLPISAQRGGSEELARQVTQGEQFTPIAGDKAEFGVPSPFGRFTATGSVFGASLLGGGIGYGLGGEEGVLPGLMLGAGAPFLFSPAALVKLAPFTTGVNA